MDLNNFYSKKYLKYKKKYLDLKGNGPNLQVGDKIIKHIKKSDFFNRATINRSRPNNDGSTTYYAQDDNSGRTFEINSKNENQNWIRENDSYGFHRNQNPIVQEAWDKHGLNPKNQKKQSSTAASPKNVFSQSTFSQSISSTNSPNDIKVNINLPIIMNQGILERINICLLNRGTIEHAHHLTLYSGTTNNYNDLKIITNNSNNIRDIFFNICNDPRNSDTGRGGYKILGRNLPNDIRNIINFDDNLNNLISTYGSVNNGGKGVFLAKVFFGNNVNFTRVYDKIKEDDSTLNDTELYKREQYENFTLHLSLAKFDNVGQALTALSNIYSSRLQAGFDNYFNYRSNFAKHLNISIN